MSQPYQTVQEPKSHKFLWVIIILAILALIFLEWYILTHNAKTSVSSNTSTTTTTTSSQVSNDKITIKNQSGQDYIQVLLPKNWLSDPYWPNNTGVGAITFFASKNNQSIAKPNTDPSDISQARSILGVVLGNTLTDLSKMDKLTSSDPNFDKILIDNKTFGGGNYRCLQKKSSDLFSVNCYVNYSQKAVNFILSTNTTNYQSDLQSFYTTIESVKFL